MKLMRIEMVWLDRESGNQPKNEYRVVLKAHLDSGNRIIDERDLELEYYDDDELIKTTLDADGDLEFHDLPPNERYGSTNLRSKEMKVGELVTWIQSYEGHSEEEVFRVTRVVPINSQAD